MEIMGDQKNPMTPDGQLHNPSIPDPKRDFQHEEITDQYYNDMKLSTLPRNGGGYSLPRHSVYEDPSKEEFSKDNAIDPNVIRSRVDPDHNIPNLNSQGKFSLIPENYTSSNSVDLIRQAHTTFNNYKNRFSSQDPSQQQPPSQAPRSGKVTLVPYMPEGIRPPPTYEESNV